MDEQRSPRRRAPPPRARSRAHGALPPPTRLTVQKPETAPISIIPSTPEVEHAGALGQELAERGEEERRAVRHGGRERSTTRMVLFMPPGPVRRLTVARRAGGPADPVARQDLDAERARRGSSPWSIPTSPAGKSAPWRLKPAFVEAAEDDRDDDGGERVEARQGGDDDPRVAVPEPCSPFGSRTWLKSPTWLAPPSPATPPEIAQGAQRPSGGCRIPAYARRARGEAPITRIAKPSARPACSRSQMSGRDDDPRRGSRAGRRWRSRAAASRCGQTARRHEHAAALREDVAVAEVVSRQ